MTIPNLGRYSVDPQLDGDRDWIIPDRTGSVGHLTRFFDQLGNVSQPDDGRPLSNSLRGRQIKRGSSRALIVFPDNHNTQSTNSKRPSVSSLDLSGANKYRTETIKRDKRKRPLVRSSSSRSLRKSSICQSPDSSSRGSASPGSRSPKSPRSLSARGTINPTTFRSPRTPKKYVPPLPEDAPLPDTSEFRRKNQKKYSSALRRILKNVKKHFEHAPIRTEMFEELVLRIIHLETRRLFFKKKGKFLSNDLQKLEPYLLEMVIKITQNSGMILFPIIERLESFRSAIGEFITNNGFTPQVKRVYTLLNDLISRENFQDEVGQIGIAEGKNLPNFLCTWKLICTEDQSKNFVKYLQDAFGITEEDRIDVLNYLDEWSAPTEKLREELQSLIRKYNWANVMIQNITEREHDWIEDPKDEFKIGDVTCNEMVRCLHTGEGIPISSFTIDGENVYSCDDADRVPEQVEFMDAIIGRICRLNSNADGAFINEELDRLIIYEQVDSLLRWSKQTDFVPDDEEYPWLNVLRAMSNSCWGKADEYIRYLFKGSLFSDSYWCAPVQGIRYILETEGSDFSLQYLRSYGVYRNTGSYDPSDPFSYTFDREKPLCRIDFNWKVYLENGTWKGILRIENIKFLEEGIRDKLDLVNIINLAGSEDPDNDLTVSLFEENSSDEGSLEKSGS